jgi:hypothetical protein
MFEFFRQLAQRRLTAKYTKYTKGTKEEYSPRRHGVHGEEGFYQIDL